MSKPALKGDEGEARRRTAQGTEKIGKIRFGKEEYETENNTGLPLRQVDPHREVRDGEYRFQMEFLNDQRF